MVKSYRIYTPLQIRKDQTICFEICIILLIKWVDQLEGTIDVSCVYLDVIDASCQTDMHWLW